MGMYKFPGAWLCCFYAFRFRHSKLELGPKSIVFMKLDKIPGALQTISKILYSWKFSLKIVPFGSCAQDLSAEMGCERNGEERRHLL